MSNLIEMPARPTTLVGRTLALNFTTCRKFTCRGFFLSPTRPAALVDDEADSVALQTALLQGKLIDITDQPRTGLNIGGMSHTAAVVEETDKKFYLGYDKAGNIYMVAPKDEEDAARIEKEIAETGTLKRDWDRAADISGVTEITSEPVPEPPRIIITDS